MRLRQPTALAYLTPAHGAALSDAPVAADRQAVEHFLLEEGLQLFLRELQEERQRELEAISRHVELSLLTLIDRQQRQIVDLLMRREQGEDVALALSEAERRLDELNDRLERRRQELERERQLTIAELTHIGSAIVLPHPQRDNLVPMLSDEEVERIAMAEAMRYERDRGWSPEDVSEQDRGFDLLSRSPEGAVRFIEVKGRSRVGPVLLTPHEYKTAERLRGDYWLYVVFDCAATPRLLPLPDPVSLEWEPIVQVECYRLDPERMTSGGSQ